MNEKRSKQLGLLSGILALAAGLIAALDIIGEPARLVHVLTIFAGGMGAGAALAQTAFEARARKRAGASDAGGVGPGAPLSD